MDRPWVGQFARCYRQVRFGGSILRILARMKYDISSTGASVGDFNLEKVNAMRWDWRDLYHWLLTLSWPKFSAFLLGVYLAVNLCFALLYGAAGGCVDGVPPGSFSSAFYFSVETLATVGYGHMYPVTQYGHLVATAEIMVGMFGTAVMTGLIFVRFSRPAARLLFSRVLVVSHFDGQPALMLRVANQRRQSMVKAEFRLMLLRLEPTREDPTMRRFHPLPLQVDFMVIFPAAVTIRHLIDERSPLYGVTFDDLRRSETRFMASVECVDQTIRAPVQSEQSYAWDAVRFDEQFVEIYHDKQGGGMKVDYSRLHDTECPSTTNTTFVAPVESR